MKSPLNKIMTLIFLLISLLILLLAIWQVVNTRGF